jgi:hypothetical protein
MLLLAANHSLYRKEEPVVKEPPPIEQPIIEEPVVATPIAEVIPEAVIETPLPPEDPPPPPPPRETWSPRWYQKARGLIDKKKQGIIEINKDSIVDMK